MRIQVVTVDPVTGKIPPGVVDVPATYATDAEVAASVAAVNTALTNFMNSAATDSEVASAIAPLNTAIQNLNNTVADLPRVAWGDPGQTTPPPTMPTGSAWFELDSTSRIVAVHRY